MIIYAFLLGFFSPSHQKEWYKYEWKKINQIIQITQRAINLTLISCAWRCSSRYKRYKVKKPYFIGNSRYTSTSIHKNTPFFLFFYFSIFPLFLNIEKKKKKKRKENIWKSNKIYIDSKQPNTKEMQDKWMNHSEESFSFQIGDLEEEEVFFFRDLYLGRWEGGLNPWKFDRKEQLLEVLQEQLKSFWIDFGFRRMTHYCFVE